MKEREELLVRAQQARAEAEAANCAKDDFLVTLSPELRDPPQFDSRLDKDLEGRLA